MAVKALVAEGMLDQTFGVRGFKTGRARKRHCREEGESAKYGNWSDGAGNKHARITHLESSRGMTQTVKGQKRVRGKDLQDLWDRSDIESKETEFAERKAEGRRRT